MKTAKAKKIIVIALSIVTAFAFTFGFMMQSTTAASKADKAANWAVTQANSNTKGKIVCMGTGANAHKSGCAVCGTSAKRKGAKYKYTYCCNPFVQAAFAHGAKSSVMSKDCKNGKPGPMTVSDFKNHKCFTVYTGKNKPALNKLKKGDVVIWNESCNIYVGGGNYVLVHEGWDANSIKVSKLSKDHYSKAKAVARYNGK